MEKHKHCYRILRAFLIRGPLGYKQFQPQELNWEGPEYLKQYTVPHASCSTSTSLHFIHHEGYTMLGEGTIAFDYLLLQNTLHTGTRY